MKKILMFLVLIAMGITTANAQRTFVPKYKKKKEVREYAMFKAERPFEVYFGGTVNFALGIQNSINFKDYDYKVGYDQKIDLMGGSVYLGANYKFGNHFTAGLEAGYLFQGNGQAIPLSGVMKVFYGTTTPKRPCRLYNYAQVGPQFYIEDGSKPVGMLAGAGVGLRLLVGQAVRMEMQLGYQMNMRRPEINLQGAYDVIESGVSFKQYAHIAQFGLNIYIF